MPNMSYCRWENTYLDLRDCFDALEENVSQTEEHYQKKLIELARKLIQEYDHLRGTE